MPAPTVASSDPVNNATSVSIQKQLSIVFSTALKRSTANEGTLLLYETDSGVPVEGKITFSTDEKTVYFLPIQELRASFSYTFSAVGAADGLPAGAVQSLDGTDLASTYTVNFRTGTERFVSLDEVTDRTDIEHVAPIREQAELAKVTGVLAIKGSTPEGFSTSQGDPSTIEVQFDENLDAAALTTSWMTLQMKAILDVEDYYYGGTISSTKKLKIEDSTVSVAQPTGTVSVSSDKLVWTRGSGQPAWPMNAEVTIKLSKDIKGASGNKLSKDIQIVFTTTVWPLWVGSQILRLELGPAVRELFDDSLNRAALWRAIQAWETAGRELSIRNPPYVAREYAKAGAVLDLLELISIKADLQRGTSKRLGDFEVNYGNRNTATDSGRYLSSKRVFDQAEQKLRRWAASLKPRFSVVGAANANGPQVFQGVRTWDNMLTGGSTIIPAANWKAERQNRIWLEQGQSAAAIYNPRDVLNTFYGRFAGAPYDRFYLVRGN